MLYVFDASFIGALIIPDEKNPYIEKMYAKIENEDEKHAPHLLWYEISNIFNNLVLRKRYSFDEVLTFVPLLAAIRLISDFETGTEYVEKLMRLCNEYKISAYDAAYLELAGRKKAVLCTFDEKLRIAAKKYGVIVLR